MAFRPIARVDENFQQGTSSQSSPTKASGLSALVGSHECANYTSGDKKQTLNVFFLQFRMKSPNHCLTKQLLSWIQLLTHTMFKFFGSNPQKENRKLLQIRWNSFRLHTLVAMNCSSNVWGENILSPNNTCKFNLRHDIIPYMCMSRTKNEW